MAAPAEQWRLLRIKSDETADDTDYVGTNTEPTAGVWPTGICATLPSGAGYEGRPYTGIEVCVLGTADTTRAPQNGSTMTVDMTLIEVVERTGPALGGAVGLAAMIMQTAAVEDVPLQTKTYWPLNGSNRFTIRIDEDLGDVVDNLEVWWRAVAR